MPESAIESIEAVTVGPNVCTESNSRNTNIDALRGLAILMVLGHHVPYFATWWNVGWAGVDLFFVLSGFLVSGLLFTEATRSNGHINIRRFYIRRAFKILPQLYVFVAVVLLPILFANRGNTRPILITIGATLTFTSNYLWTYCLPVVGHLWSLAVEEHFYLALPVLLLGLRRFAIGPDPFRAICYLFPLIGVLDCVLRFVSAAHCVGAGCGIFSFPTHLRADELLFGVLLSYLRHYRQAAFQRIAQSWIVFGISAAAITAILFIPCTEAILHAFAITLAYLGLGALLPLTIDRHWPIPLRWITGFLAPIGRWSYGTYLWHGFAVGLLPHRNLADFVVYLIVAIGIGALGTIAVEKRALAFRERLFPSALKRECPASLKLSPPASVSGDNTRALVAAAGL